MNTRLPSAPPGAEADAGALAAAGAVAGAASPTGPQLVEVAEAEAGERVDRLIARHLPALSRSRVKALIEAGALVETRSGAGPGEAGATIDEPSTRVKAGQRFRLTVPAAAPARPEAQARALDILYEDDWLLVLDKPAGLVVHPAPGNPDRTLVNALLAHCGEDFQGIGGERRPGIVHRLDKDTSGLMVVAKTEAAHQALSLQFAERTIERRYRALAWGRLLPPGGAEWGEIVGNIGRSPRNRKKMAVLASGGKTAVTRYRLERLLAGGAVSMVICRLLTGRTHQIRVHLAGRGHPLLGDPLYGRPRPAALAGLPEPARSAAEGFGRQALHAESLGFEHPADRRRLLFEAPPPSDMIGLIGNLELL